MRPMADETIDDRDYAWWDEAPYLLDLIAIGPEGLCRRAHLDSRSESMAAGIDAFYAVDHRRQCEAASPCRVILDLAANQRFDEAERIAQNLIL